jgi:hypothetical protein
MSLKLLFLSIFHFTLLIFPYDKYILNLTQLAIATSSALYGPRYGQWLKASVIGNACGFEPTQPPPITSHSSSHTHSRGSRGRGRKRGGK